MKQLKVVFSLLLVALLLAGCGTKDTKNVDAAKAADDLKSALTFQDELSEATQELRDRTYGISADDVVSGKLYLSSGATAEEIAVFEAKDDAAAERLLAAAKERVEAQKTAFEDYAPAEMTKLNNAVVERNGKIVALCIADDSSAAQKKDKRTHRLTEEWGTAALGKQQTLITDFIYGKPGGLVPPGVFLYP